MLTSDHCREAGCKETGPGCEYSSACDLSTWQGRTWPCGKDGGSWKKYYGRGAKQLSYNFNYGPFSDAMFGTVTRQGYLQRISELFLAQNQKFQRLSDHIIYAISQPL